MSGQNCQPMRRDTRVEAMERISFSVEELPEAEEWYGRGAMGVLGLGFAGGGLRQPITDRFHTGRIPPVGKKGLRQDIGRICVGIVALFLAVALLVFTSDMLTLSARVAHVKRDIAHAEQLNDQLSISLEEAENGINVGYEAAQMGMVSAQSADIIYVTLPVTIRTTLTADNLVMEEGRLASIAEN